jgi:oxygen-dependent protoporphyrinogen oxidase
VTVDALVVGGGLTGLALASRLTRAGRAVRLLDARDEVGGNIRTEVREDERGRWLLELGPNSFGDASEELMQLARDAGIEDEVVRAPDLAGKRYLFRNGGLVEVPTKPPRMLLSPMLPVRGRLRMMLEPFIRPGKADEPEETLAAFCDRRLGPWARKKLLTPVVSGIYAGDPEALGAESAFPRMIALEREHGSLIRAAIKGNGPPSRGRLSSFEEGLAALPRALGAVLGDAVRSRETVASIGRRRDGWKVATADGDEHLTRRLVLATPTWVTAKLLEPLAARLARELRQVEYAPMLVVHVGVRKEQLRYHPPGFGFLVPREEGIRILGAIFSSTLFPGRAPEGHELLTVFSGGALDPDAIRLEDDRIRDYVLDDLGRALGLQGDPALFQVTRWERAIPQYLVGHRRRLERIDQGMTEFDGLHLAGNWRGGIAMPDCVRAANALAERIGEG